MSPPPFKGIPCDVEEFLKMDEMEIVEQMCLIEQEMFRYL